MLITESDNVEQLEGGRSEASGRSAATGEPGDWRLRRVDGRGPLRDALSALPLASLATGTRSHQRLCPQLFDVVGPNQRSPTSGTDQLHRQRPAASLPAGWTQTPLGRSTILPRGNSHSFPSSFLCQFTDE